VPADQSKLTIHHPKVEPNPRNLVAATDRATREEEAATELAFRIACEDPTERDHLSCSVGRARGRLEAAAAELVRSALALLFAYLASLSLGRFYRKVTASRGEVGRAERGTLALEALLARFLTRRLLGTGRLLWMIGAVRREDDEGETIHALKLAERRYHLADGSRDYAVASDSPVVRVLLGVRVAGCGEPAWVLKRFESTGTGAWREIHAGCTASAEHALLRFYWNPSQEESAAPEPDLAPVPQELREPEPPAAAADAAA
jgi:hypothetical protein